MYQESLNLYLYKIFERMWLGIFNCLLGVLGKDRRDIRYNVALRGNHAL